MQPYQLPSAAISVTQRSLHMNKFYVIIYHPSRFAPLTPINMLIYRYLNSVIDTSKTEKSITLSITIWGYPSRFSHHTLSDTAYHCWKAYNGWHHRRLWFHGMKYFVSFHETVCFKRRNTSFHPVKRTDTCSFLYLVYYLESYSWWRLTINNHYS